MLCSGKTVKMMLQTAIILLVIPGSLLKHCIRLENKFGRRIQIKYCCPGYLQGKVVDAVPHCIPNCSPPCDNGICNTPQKCKCNAGYKNMKQGTLDNCVPHCSSGCLNGRCVGLELCSCDDGYESRNGECSPICPESCSNGVCVSPGDCTCHPGYVKESNSTCVPACIYRQITGFCSEYLTLFSLLAVIMFLLVGVVIYAISRSRRTGTRPPRHRGSGLDNLIGIDNYEINLTDSTELKTHINNKTLNIPNINCPNHDLP